MKLIGQTTIISYKTKSFTNAKQEKVEYAEVAFHDEEGNKLTATVPESARKDVQLTLDSEDKNSVTGEGTFEVVSASSNGKSYTKLKLVAFK